MFSLDTFGSFFSLFWFPCFGLFSFFFFKEKKNAVRLVLVHFLIDLNFVRESIVREIFTTKHNTFTKLSENIITASRKVCIFYY